MAPNSVARYKNTLNVALNWYIKETGIDWTSPFAGLLVKGAGSSKADKLKTTFEDDPITNALLVILRDTGARLAEVAGLRVTDCNMDEGFIHITPTPWRCLKNAPLERSVRLLPGAQAVIRPLISDKDPEAPLFSSTSGPAAWTALPQGDHRQEAVDAIPAPPDEGRAQEHRLP